MKTLLAVLALLLAVPAVAADAPRPRSAFKAPLAAQVPLVTAARAGERMVAAGDYGVVLLSDDNGKTWRQAREVPTTTMITSVVFRDQRHGWATAHGGLILASGDGGEHWRVAHRVEPDVVPMAIAFDDRGVGVVVGTYGFALRTEDGGKTWAKATLDGGDIPDRHLNHVFATGPSAFVVAAESGAIFRTADGGLTWSFDELPIKGSLWSGTMLRDGSLLVAGMGGRLFRLEGNAWREVDTATEESITGILEPAAGQLVLVGLSGTVMQSNDGGRSFVQVPRSDRIPYAAALAAGGDQIVLFGGAGVATAKLTR